MKLTEQQEKESERIKAIQKRIGLKGTQLDGFWGPVSTSQAKKYLLSMMPKKNPWPTPDEKSLLAFYGKPCASSHQTKIDVVGLGVKYGGAPVKTITCHEKIADSLLRILTSISQDEVSAPILAKFDGCYNCRPMVGGTKYSLHARSAAVDFWAGENLNKEHWPVSALMPIEFMEHFAREGVTSAGVFWSRDAMHQQWTKPVV